MVKFVLSVLLALVFFVEHFTSYYQLLPPAVMYLADALIILFIFWFLLVQVSQRHLV